MYMISKGQDIFNSQDPPKEQERSSRRNNCNSRIRRQLTDSRIRHHFFTNREANDWNCLHKAIMDKENINLLKNSIDKYFNF
jgi:hypothetical protein